MNNEQNQKNETPFEKFQRFTKKIISVPKAEMKSLLSQVYNYQLRLDWVTL